MCPVMLCAWRWVKPKLNAWVTAVRLRPWGEFQPRLRLIPQSQAVRVAFVRILIESGEVRPAVDDLANMPGRERLVEFERAVNNDRLEDEGVVAVAVKVTPAPGVQLQVMVDGLLDVLGVPLRLSIRQKAGDSLEPRERFALMRYMA